MKGTEHKLHNQWPHDHFALCSIYMHHLVFMNSPQTVQSVTHQLWLPIPQETARPRRLPLPLNMEGKDKESPALFYNHQVALTERAHSPATDHLMCSSNQTATARSTTYAHVAHRLSLVQTVHCSSAVEMQSPAFSSTKRTVQTSWTLLLELLCAGRWLCSVHWRHGWGRHIIPCILNLDTREISGQRSALVTFLLQQELWYA